MRLLHLALAWLVGAGVSTHFTYATEVLNEDFKILANDGAFGDQFGRSVSMSGDRALIGAPYDDDYGWESGSAYVYLYDGIQWNQEAKLIANEGETGDFFGFSVAISGDIAVASAPRYNGFTSTGMGAVCIFTRNPDGSWLQTQKITADDGETDSGDVFGFSVHIDGDRIIVGDPFDNVVDTKSGSAYIFKRTEGIWIQEAKLVPSDASSYDHFGYSVSIDGNRALVSAVYDDTEFGDATGSAYVFNFDGSQWIESSKLQAADAETGDNFGHSVSISGDRALIGAYGEDGVATFAGAAYVFHVEHGQWSEESKLTASDGYANDNFGWSVSLSGNIAVVGAYDDKDNGSASGSAYTFQLQAGQWTQVAKLLPSDGDESDYFGWSVCISGSNAITGAHRNDDNFTDSGSAYVYELMEDGDGDGVADSDDNCYLYNPDQADCNGNGIGDICDIADGSVNDMNENSIPDECECLADTNPDGVVDVQDLLLVIALWGNSGGQSDINYDGIVDVLDLLGVIQAWGDCP